MISHSTSCPSCHANLRVNRPPSADRQVRCPQCGTSFVMSAAAFRAALAAREPPEPLDALAPGAPTSLPSQNVPPLMSTSQCAALIGAVFLVGGGIIAAIVMTRTPPVPKDNAPAVRAETSPVPKTLADDSDKIRQKPEKQRAEPPRDKHEDDKRQAGFARFMQQGKEAMTAGQYAAAVRAFKQAVQLLPDDEAAGRALSDAQTALAADETQKAKLADYQNHMTAGQAAAVAGRYADAVRDYVAALQILPGNAAALQGQRLAENQLALLQDQGKRKAEYARLVDLAGTALRNQRFKDAVDNYTSALKLLKDDPTAQRGLAEAQQGLNNQAAALARQLALADAAMRSGRYADATLAFQAAIQLSPTNAIAAQGLLAAQAALANNLKTAQAAYLQFMTQGAAALTARQFADAVLAYNSALQLVPNDPAAQQGLRDAEARLALLLPGIGDFDRELQRGLADLNLQRFREASRHFKAALKLRPDSIQAARGLRQARYGEAMADGRAALTARRYVDAVRSFEEALVQVPGDPAATQALRQARTLSNGKLPG